MIGKISLRYALILGAVALFCTAISAVVFGLTKSRIDAVTAQQQRQLLQEVVPLSHFDNDLLATCKVIDLPERKFLNRIYFAEKDGKQTAYAIQATAPDGYSGNIVVLIGIQPDGTVLGVRTLQHAETPGLGDKIETRVSDWIYSFTNRLFSLDNEKEWAVKKDGGVFDQFAGATITPRAVVNVVKNTAKWTIADLAKQPEIAEPWQVCP